MTGRTRETRSWLFSAHVAWVMGAGTGLQAFAHGVDLSLVGGAEATVSQWVGV